VLPKLQFPPLTSNAAIKLANQTAFHARQILEIDLSALVLDSVLIAVILKNPFIFPPLKVLFHYI